MKELILSILVAIYTLALIYAFYFGGVWTGSTFIVIGVLSIFLIRTYQNFLAERTADLIKEGTEKPFIDINKVPWYILAKLVLVHIF